MINENRVSITNEYEKGKTHVLLKHPLTIDEWNEILENQRIVEKLKAEIKFYEEVKNVGSADNRIHNHLVLHELQSIKEGGKE